MYTIHVNDRSIPAAISIKGDTQFAEALFMDFMDIPSVLNCIAFNLGELNYFVIYVDPAADIKSTELLVRELIDDAYTVEYLIRDLSLNGKDPTKQQSAGRSD